MQFKTVLLALAAMTMAVSINAQATENNSQAIEDNSCSQCTFGSIAKEPKCAALEPNDASRLQAAFANNNANITLLAKAVETPAIKDCVCGWATDTFGPTGAAASCVAAQGSTPPDCSAEQVAEAASRMSPVATMLHCDAAAPPAADGSSSGGNEGTGTSTNAGSLLSSNLPYAVSMTVFGLVALAGL
ncbi:hypothetical protein BG011_005085 [Mortierella polycephala]|uniref:Uncharacterized protein n=1 Tax=Mortierella polycephala TaxID=41804 RepID=A0A9P6PY53_9FUNG|nr:hypothetical protein BG011_005085 [Mortierella polycephala]